MGDEAQDYTATGPTDIAFRTGGDGTAIDNGVVAQGKITGVTGIGLAPVGSEPQPIGVIGKGQTGVEGLGHQPEGTFPDSSVGVFGQGFTGVKGSTEGRDGIGVDGDSTDGIGVKGFSENNDGIVGRSNGEHKSGVFGENVNDRAGGAGVDGHSNVGSGVRGRSDKSYGGVFGGNFAQIRLEPADLRFGPPTNTNTLHVRGEFFVDANGGLFFCTGGSPPSWVQLAGPSLVSQLVHNFKVFVVNLTR